MKADAVPPVATDGLDANAAGQAERDRLARACIASMYDNDSASRALGMELLHVACDRAELGMTVRDDMVNGHGICHGGLVFALADSAFAFACNSRNRAAVAADCYIDFLRPGRQGDRLTATAALSHVGRSGGLCRVTVVNHHGKDVAHCRGRFHYLDAAVMPGPAP